jgi:hypothetical protein
MPFRGVTQSCTCPADHDIHEGALISLRPMKATTLVTLILLGVCPLIAQDTAGVGGVQGTVVLEGGGPVREATVCLPAANRCVTTTNDGSFRLSELRPGEYELSVTANGRLLLQRTGISVRAGVETWMEASRRSLSANLSSSPRKR